MKRDRIKKLRSFPDRDLDAQFREIVSGLDWFLGIQDTDPDTTTWGANDFFLWVNNATPAAKVIKFWNGAAVRTISST